MALAKDRAVRGLLFDRDDTLVIDVPYNADPHKVVPVPGAHRAVERARTAGLRVGVVTNQSAIAKGLATREQVDATNARVDELVGPFDVWCVCPHDAGDGCACRKPRPGMVLDAARRLGLDPSEIVVVGDIGADVGAAAAAGAQGVLVPTPRTRAEEVEAAETVAGSLDDAVSLVLARVPAARA
ncbi:MULTISPECIES: HAD-IIIA family hydrolase [unclassified Curtobacterium]|jgi:HAD superfamily hydrolase (TIGR01662 family)|uniref:D-glycero-alpha-D-manno-heptose-1,7-bisphosphate 7-phosphatase n=1 Tax=unclassified Curtobacterium TaxID=257496 RepID=UPI00052AB889|nr:MULTISPECIES: HAD-IIIA family hydrolase [unclassified Curtobacterium]AIV40139.1 haloacid dehalogenase [Curtobacterium sp. MR_MD2014]MBP1300369.1 HAD superfamily hydrolase (TIGR01662 family) [Curtobacterium sp. 1310]MCM3506098.1 HAD family hydrolase [Curtobacterium sp. ODYSSEY 48 V2]MCM3521603.1 HAD family hydrolase [Curtobacterium sp. P97]MDB6426740.1 HAD-IIIA family hydrolase [Curtobacterium sp. 20TX0008]